MLLEDYKKSIYLCTRCGYCRDMVRFRDTTDLMCPLRETTGGFESFLAKGRNWIARQALEGKISAKDFSEKFIDHLYSDLLCGNCTKHCLVLDPKSWTRFPDDVFEDHLINVDAITISLRNLVVEEGNPPIQILNVLRNTGRFGNPLGEPPGKRDAFTKNIDFDIKNATEEKCEALLYIGSVASYNERNQKTVEAVVRILNAAKVDFGIFGTEEIESGGYVRELGEEGLFEELAQRNFELLSEHDIKKIICFSPHDYYAFIKYYPDVLKGGLKGINVQHYTEFVSDLIRNKRLRVKGNLGKTMTFHDPCYLGRKSGLYNSRDIIQATGGKLIEMRLSRGNSYCCGAGGGGLWYEPEDKPKIENQRAKQALETGAELLLVACPQCAQMLENGMEAVEGKMKVVDVAEIVEENMVH